MITFLIILAAVFFIYGGLQSKSGAQAQTDPKSSKWYSLNRNMPYTETMGFWFGVITVVAALIFLLATDNA